MRVFTVSYLFVKANTAQMIAPAVATNANEPPIIYTTKKSEIKGEIISHFD